MATEHSFSNPLMWKDGRLLEDVNGKCVEELMGIILVLLVEASFLRLLGCCAMDVSREAETSSFTPFPSGIPPMSDFTVLLCCLRICKMSLHFKESVACGKTTGSENTSG